MARKALGRGLRALIPEAVKPQQPAETTDTTEQQTTDNESPSLQAVPETTPDKGVARDYLRYIDIDLIIPNTQQPRTEWVTEDLEDLTRSIISRGLLEPIILRQKGDKYEIIAGERRWRACKIAGWEEIPAIVRTVEDCESLELALIENVQRSNLNPVDEARAYKVLATTYRLTHDDIANRMGKDRTTITNLLRILKLSDDILRLVSNETISLGHARVLLGVAEEKRPSLVSQIVREGWSVREAENWVRKYGNSKQKPARTSSRGQKKPEYISRLEDELCRHFSAEVKIKLARKGGRLEIQYTDEEELSRILEQLRIVVA
jgi:ParB family transcriptional regulator, chromosome partitioning protein